jgi:hypothetical protein
VAKRKKASKVTRKIGPSIDGVAVHRVRGGSAPSPLAKTRSGNPRRKPSPVTIRRADGSSETVSAKQFAARHGEPSWVALDRDYHAQLRAYRAGEISHGQLRAFAVANGLEQRLGAALQRGAGGGRLDAIPGAAVPGRPAAPAPSRRPRRRKRKPAA